MLEVCRRKAAEAGIAERCEFHAAYLHELPPPTEPYDTATSILVSHFITDRARRVATSATSLGVCVPMEFSSRPISGCCRRNRTRTWCRYGSG
jgi:hypothetical protein